VESTLFILVLDRGIWYTTSTQDPNHEYTKRASLELSTTLIHLNPHCTKDLNLTITNIINAGQVRLLEHFSKQFLGVCSKRELMNCKSLDTEDKFSTKSGRN